MTTETKLQNFAQMTEKTGSRGARTGAGKLRRRLA